MEIGIGLPAQLPGVKPEFVLDWARKADAGPFSCLGLIDRLVFPNYEPLIALAAAAAVTQRVRLLTNVLLLTLRNPGVVAKQAATLDVISNGRLTLGIGIGGREDDFHTAPAQFRGRGKRMEEQIALMRRLWSGQGATSEVGPVGPQPVQAGGPEILIGGFAPAALRRAGRLADGYLGPGADPSALKSLFGVVEESWKQAGRAGKPRLVVGSYYALGPNSQDRGTPFISDYYSFQPDGGVGMAQRTLFSEQAVKQLIQDYSDVGVDELVLWPTVIDSEQFDRLAQVVG